MEVIRIFESQIITICLAIAVIYFMNKYFSGGIYQIPQIDLRGKCAIVTGGNSGIGRQTVIQLAKLGCKVIIGDYAIQHNQLKRIIKQTKNQSIQYVFLDLSNKSSIQQFAKIVPFQKIDYLINNAGVMGVPERKLTKEGHEWHFGVNYLGHFYLTYLLWDKITKSTFFRVVNISSITHRRYVGFLGKVTLDFNNMNFDGNYNGQVAYSRSKLYMVLFTRALARRIDSKKGFVLTLNPGVTRTNITRYMESDGIKGLISKYSLKLFWPIYCIFTKSAREGNQTTMFALLSSQLQNGQYYSDCKKSQVNQICVKHNEDELWKKSNEIFEINFEQKI